LHFSLLLSIFPQITCYYYYGIGVLALIQEMLRTDDTMPFKSAHTPTKKKEAQTPTAEKAGEPWDLWK